MFSPTPPPLGGTLAHRYLRRKEVVCCIYTSYKVILVTNLYSGSTLARRCKFLNLMNLLKLAVKCGKLILKLASVAKYLHSKYVFIFGLGLIVLKDVRALAIYFNRSWDVVALLKIKIKGFALARKSKGG